MRINLYFKDNSEKDAVILKMLNDKYSPKDYIKETLVSDGTHAVLNSN